MAKKREVGGQVVREWARSEAGQAAIAKHSAKVGREIVVGTRGKFSQDLLDAFHANNRHLVYSVGHVKPIKLTGVRRLDSGKAVPVTFNATVPAVRAFAKAQGIEVGDRGLLPKAAFEAYAAAHA